MRHYFFAIGIILGLACDASAQSCYAQQSSCYSQAYAPQAEPFALSAQTQSYTVQVPVTVTVQAQAQPVAVASPAPCSQNYGYAAPVALPFVQSYGAVGYGGCNNVGFSGVSYAPNFGLAWDHRVGFVNRAYDQNFRGQSFRSVGAVGGTGITLQARDRRGNQVIANGVNNVSIQRGFLGRINGATADANRGLLGRVSPF